ncbi:MULTISPECIES: S8 family serine peptidase, partial [unclassified Microcoleus]|uniref:S8 family serine peptidase n=1 Tax=unclassified Microcoleus TaxID=2642155 RepID=UPI002FD1334A
AWNQYYALEADSTSSLNNAWNQYSALASDSTSSLNNAGNQYNALNNAWDDWVSDTEAEMNVWAKIAASENRWYKTSLADTLLKAGLPLVGIIDTGFRVNNPDIDSSRISLGKDWIDGDNNPLLQLGEGDEHGTQMLEIIAATRNNNIGIDGINDRSPLWLGRAVGSGDWAQSLIEFVDAAKASGQPNAVINLSFDLTQTNSDGSLTTRQELTGLERAALTYAQLNNVLIVAAAGNENSILSALGQATKEFDNIITVGAAEGWNRANYSSYSEVDYANYGKGVDILAQGGASNGASGTSVAAAKVTGAASLMWAANPQLNYSQVMDILKRTATDLNTPNWDSQTGLGLLNIHAAVYLAKATQPEVYTLGSLEFVQDTLKTYHIPEVYWPEFYELYYYYDLEAKYERQAWSGKAGATATERADGWGAVAGAVVGGAVGGAGGAVVGAVVGNYIEHRSGGGNDQAVQQAQEERDRIKKEGNKAVDAAKKNVDAAKKVGGDAIKDAEDNVKDKENDGKGAITTAENKVKEKEQQGQTAIKAAEDNVNKRQQEAQAAVTEAENRVEYAKRYAPETVEKLQQELAEIKSSTALTIAQAKQELDQTKTAVQQTIAQAKQELEQTKTTVQQTIAQAKQELEQTKTTVQQTIAQAEQELARTKQYYQQKLAEADEKLQKAKEDFERARKSNNPFQQFANDLEKGLKSSLDGIDVGAAVAALKKIPVVGTVVNGIEGLIALVQNDWKGVVKSGINGVLKIIPGGSAVPEKVVNILIDVGWGLISKDYKTALKDVLKELEVKDKVANTFVDVAWAMKDGDWKSVLGAGLSGAGFSNADKFVGIAWGVKDGDYTKALMAGLEVAGLDKLGINSNQAQAFVKSAIALKDNQTSKVADELLSVAGTQFTNSSWVRDLKDSNPNNDRAAVTQGLSAIGFKNVEKWVSMAWDVKDKNYLNAISAGFSLGGFTQGKDWVDMAWSLQRGDYLKALSTGFKVAGFAEGEHLAKAAVNLREGKYLDAFFEGIRIVPGVGDLINAFEAVGAGNFKGVANSLAKVATNPTLLTLLVS